MKTMENLYFKYCPHCASPMEMKEEGGRTRPRCPSCGFIQYLNPTVGVAVVILEGDRILLGKRADHVSYGGMWCIPCGHLEWDEEVREAAMREFKEETGLEVRLTGIVAVYSNFHNPRQHTVGIWFRGEVVGGHLQAGDDLVEVGFFPLDNPPEPLAFPTDRLVIEELNREINKKGPQGKKTGSRGMGRYLRVAVLGTGGVGGYFGARLAQAGHEVIFIARGDHLKAIREHGLKVESILGNVLIRPARATDDTREAGPVDVVLVATKAWQLPQVIRTIPPMVGEGTVVVPLLNGVEAPEILARALGPEPVLGGLCKISAFKAAPGLIRHVGVEPEVIFGELDGCFTPRVKRLEEAFALAKGVKVTVPRDIRAAMWAKMTFIAAFSAVGAVTRAPAGVIRRLPQTRRLLEEAMKEIVAVAQALGVDLPPETVHQAMAFTDQMEPHVTASMQRDIMEGRPSELEAQTGAVVKLGRKAGIPTPVNDFLYAALLPQELRARGGETWE